MLARGLLATVGIFHLGLRGAIWVLVAAPLIAYGCLTSEPSTHLRRAMGLEMTTLVTFAPGSAAAATLASVIGGPWNPNSP